MTTEIVWPSDNEPSKRWPLYSRGNVGEVFPDVVYPLEWGLGGMASEIAWREASSEIGFLTKDDFGPGDFVVVGVFGGYAYFNASLMRLLGVRTPGMGPEVTDTQFLGDADIAAYQPQPGDRNLKATAKVIRTALKTMTAKSVPRLEQMETEVRRSTKSAPAFDSSSQELWQWLKTDFPKTWTSLTRDHVINTLQATIAAGSLTDFCEKHLGDPSMAVALTTGLGDVVSARPAKEMWRLANETTDSDFDDQFERFLEQFGHRGPNEFSIAGQTWGEFPDVAMAAIDAMRGMDADRSPLKHDQRINAAHAATLEEAEDKLGPRRSRRLNKAIASTAMWSRAREQSKDALIRGNRIPRQIYLELNRRAHLDGGVEDYLGPMVLTIEEFDQYMADPTSMLETIERRHTERRELSALVPPFAFDASQHGNSFPPHETWLSQETTEQAIAPPGTTLSGAAGAPGVASGPARVVRDPGDPSALEHGAILVAPLTDPAWTPLFLVAAGVVVEVGAAMSHSMIVSRELGIPCVVGVEDATKLLADGAMVEVDGQAGTVKVLP